ncbi:MAG: ATP-binding protein [Vulcanimicrobiota bacterium]
MFIDSGELWAEKYPAKGLQVSDIDLPFFRDFYESHYGPWDENPLLLPRLVENMNLAKDGALNVAGALLFVSEPHFRLPTFIIKAVVFQDNDFASTNFLEFDDLYGKLSVVFQSALGFVLRNLRPLQDGRGFNTLGEPEIPRLALEELIANALIHRDYFTSAAIRLLVFPNRIEIVSPGCLPKNLTVENIKLGNSNMRNPILASFATKLLPYRGLGSGIVRALKAYPDIDFENDRDGNLFRVTVQRKQA